MLMDEFGKVVVNSAWKVDEKKPIGYSRVYCIKGGSSVYYDDSAVIKLKKDNIYIFPSSKPYKIESDVNNRLSCLYLHMNFSPVPITELIELKTEDDKFLKRLFDTMECAIIDGYKVILENLVSSFKEYLIVKHIISQCSPIVTEAILYMTENYDKPLSLQQISNYKGYNKSYFIRLFKKYTGISPYKYLTNIRMEKGYVMIENGMSVSEAASKVGYNDLCTFSRNFKIQFGITPLQCRMKMYRSRKSGTKNIF